MAYSERARAYAAATLEERRLASRDIDERHRATLYADYPDIAEYDRKLASLGVSIAFASLGDNVSYTALQGELTELEAERNRYIEEKGIDRSLLAPHVFCGDCGDTGYRDGKPCRCLKKLMADYTLAEINRVSPLALSSFSKFSLDYYADGKDESYGVSPKSNMKKVLGSCQKFARDFPAGENLLMMGDAGLGKTHLALSIASEVLARGHDVLYCSAANIFKTIEAEYFENGRDNSTLAGLKHCDLLVLDDLGAEFVNAFLVSTLYDIVNTRIVEKKSTIYTTNITKVSLLETRYGEKVSSRLIGCCRLLSFFGDDIRMMLK